jgi:hypothetical protein
LTGRGPEESGTDACNPEEEDDNAKVVVATLYGRRRLGVVLGSKASCGRTGTSASVLEPGQCRDHRRSDGACGEAEVVPSEEEKGGLASMIVHGRRWIRTASAPGGGASVGKRATRSTSVGGTATQCLAGTGDRAHLPWALAIWPVGRGPLKPGGLHWSNGSAQFPRLKILFQLFQTTSSLQNTKVVPPAL